MRKNFAAVFVLFVLAVVLTFCTFAAPAPVTVGDKAGEGFLSGDVMYLLSDNGVEIDLGNRASVTNVRYAEIDGVQTEIAENNNKYSVSVGDKNMLVEITEKTDKNSTSVVRT